MDGNHSLDILIVDDEESMIKLLTKILTFRNYHITSATNGFEALRLVKSKPFDLIILDVMLPEIDGFETCKKMRNYTKAPILMLSAMCSEEDKVKGLNSGADEYLAKPFGTKELVARIEALYRRVHKYDGNQENVKDSINYGVIKLDKVGRRVFVSGEEVKLTKKEFNLLQLFMEHIGHAFSRQQLLDCIWGMDFLNATTRTVDTHVKTLRLKLKQGGAYIQTIWSVGYKFEKNNRISINE